MWDNLEGRINTRYGTRRIPNVERAQEKLLSHLMAMARAKGWEGAIDVSYFDEEARAYAPLIVELKSKERRYNPKDVYVNYVYLAPVGANGRVADADAKKAAGSIRKKIPEIVDQVRDAMTYFNK